MQRPKKNPRVPRRVAKKSSESKRGLSCLVLLGGSVLSSPAVALAGCGHPTIFIEVKDEDASVSVDAGADADAGADEDGGE